MWEDPLFRGGAAQRWAQLRAGPWSDAAIAGRISELTAKASRKAGGCNRLGWSGQQVVLQALRRPPLEVCCVPLRRSSHSSHHPCVCRHGRSVQIKPAAVRNYVRYTWVLVKPWMQGSVEQIWGNGACWACRGTKGRGPRVRETWFLEHSVSSMAPYH